MNQQPYLSKTYFDEAPKSIHIIPMGKDNYAYAVEGEDFVLGFDPMEAEGLLSLCHKLGKPLRAVFVTHHHQDHTAGLFEIKKHFPKLHFIGPKGAHPLLNRHTQNKDIIEVSSMEIHCLYLGAHTKDHFAYYLPFLGVLLVGDFLFPSGCGFDFEGGPIPIFQQLEFLKNLPHETWVYSGHEYGLKNAAFSLQYDSSPKQQERYDLFLKRRKAGLPTVPTKISLELEHNLFYHSNNTHLQVRLGLLNQDAFDCFVCLLSLKKEFVFNESHATKNQEF